MVIDKLEVIVSYTIKLALINILSEYCHLLARGQGINALRRLEKDKVNGKWPKLRENGGPVQIIAKINQDGNIVKIVAEFIMY